MVTNQPFGHANLCANLPLSTPSRRQKSTSTGILSVSSLSLSELKLDLNFNVVAGELTSQAIVGGAALDLDKSATVCDILTVKFAG